DQVVVLRGYVRQRAMLIAYAAQHVQHLQKALQEMNLKLTLVVSDVVGKTGMAIIKAILAGQRNPQELAQLRDERCRHTAAEIAKALVGNGREEHLLALRQAVELDEFDHSKIVECDQAINADLKSFPDRSGGQPSASRPPRLQKGQGKPSPLEARQRLSALLGVDRTAVEGIDVGVALVIAAEVGPDVS